MNFRCRCQVTGHCIDACEHFRMSFVFSCIFNQDVEISKKGFFFQISFVLRDSCLFHHISLALCQEFQETRRTIWISMKRLNTQNKQKDEGHLAFECYFLRASKTGISRNTKDKSDFNENAQHPKLLIHTK